MYFVFGSVAHDTAMKIDFSKTITCVSHSSNALRLGTGEELFNFLADCVQDFVHELGMEDQEFSLGKYYQYRYKVV